MFLERSLKSCQEVFSGSLRPECRLWYRTWLIDSAYSRHMVAARRASPIAHFLQAFICGSFSTTLTSQLEVTCNNIPNRLPGRGSHIYWLLYLGHDTTSHTIQQENISDHPNMFHAAQQLDRGDELSFHLVLSSLDNDVRWHSFISTDLRG